MMFGKDQSAIYQSERAAEEIIRDIYDRDLRKPFARKAVVPGWKLYLIRA